MTMHARSTLLLLVPLGMFVGCTNPDGRFRPPDPIGYAIFEALDRGPRHSGSPRSSDADYVGSDDQLSARGHPPSPDSVWVDGTWGSSNGQRVWIPAHWQ
jgi:hypothetical protein